MRRSLIAAVALEFAHLTFASNGKPFELPGCVLDSREDTSGRTWQMTGTATNAFENVRDAFYTNIKTAGYTLRHEIPMDNSGRRILVAWKKKGKELILMMWPQGGNCTAFAYGETEQKECRKK